MKTKTFFPIFVLIASLLFSCEKKVKTEYFEFKDGKWITSTPYIKDACGSDPSISKALDQCDEKGFIRAHCVYTDGVWVCTGTERK